MRTAPSLALKALLNWPPLYVMVQGAAAMAAYRLMRTAQWQGEMAQWSHTTIAGTLREASPAAFLRHDRDLVRYRFDATYKVVYPDRTSWTTETGPLQGQSLIWYTDGSKIEEGSGAGVCLSASNKEVSIPLGKHCTGGGGDHSHNGVCAGEPLGGVQRQKNLHLFRQSSRSKGVGAAENQFSPGEEMQGGVKATTRAEM